MNTIGTGKMGAIGNIVNTDRNGQILLNKGIIAKQADLACFDPYANAFNESFNGAGRRDDTVLNGHVWERKYEVDSLCAPVWKVTGIDRIFTGKYYQYLRETVRVFTTEQDHSKSPYYFQRYGCAKTDTLPNGGRGNPVKVTGMTWSGFRLSDDCCDFGYLIPSNMMAVKAMCFAAEICRKASKSTG